MLGGDLSGLFTELGGVVSASELLSSSGPVTKERCSARPPHWAPLQTGKGDGPGDPPGRWGGRTVVGAAALNYQESRGVKEAALLS